MGGKKRNRFERIYTDSESESTDEEEKISDTDDANLIKDQINDNNSNSTVDEKKLKNGSTSSQGKNYFENADNTQNQKFLITRSKRKYSKPDIRFKINQSEKDKQSSKNSKDEKSLENKIEEKPKRETIRSLNSKIVDANNFLIELNNKLQKRDQEIDSLKQAISKNRLQDISSKTEVEKAIMPNSETNEGLPFETMHDFPILDSEIEDNGSEDDLATISEVNPQLLKSSYNDIDENPKSRKRSRSRSRSRDKGKRHKGHRSRSRSRNRDGSTQQSTNRLQEYRNDPDIQGLVKQMVAEQVKEEIEKRKKLDNTSGMINSVDRTPKFLSTSDTSVYTPAVPTVNIQKNLSGSPKISINEKRMSGPSPFAGIDAQKQYTPDKYTSGAKASPGFYDPESINNTLTRLRIVSGQQPRASTSRLDNNEERREQISNARNIAENAIIEAERHKARIQQPNRGKSEFCSPNPIDFNNQMRTPKCDTEVLRHLRYLDSEDDEFFHTTCHIEETLKEKIGKGGFVELEKLIQKRILQSGPKDDSRMQLVNRDGVSYFVPSIDRETKIDGIKKWEQAFRVYTTIYCKANPTRAGEILQYVDIIHRAAAIFNWDNVARYDYVFRQLMATKPHRSWAKVYTQMWNITLNEPIKKFNDNGSNGNGNYKPNNTNRRDSFCWKYNKSTCTYGKNCRFEHKCSYCGVKGHPVGNCHKKNGKRGSGKDRQQERNSTSSSSSSTNH